jgi:hypothetical protein
MEKVTRKQAWAIIHKYDKRIERLRWRAYNGDDGAPFRRLQLMNEQIQKLAEAGWRFADTPNGSKRRIEDVNTPRKQKPLNEIEQAATDARNGDPDAPLRLIKLLLGEKGP